jgi:hypothetical protein
MRETNWSGTHAYGAAALHRPASVEELQEIVAAARGSWLERHVLRS